jgi:hypothetical protein
MSDIHLNEKELAFIRKMIDEGRKSDVINDLFISVTEAVVTVTNVHTGDEMRVLNWCR